MNLNKMQITPVDIQNVFPSFERDKYVKWIRQIQEQLCPTCMENQDFNQEAKHDCKYGPKYLSAENIYDGNCSKEAMKHWLDALIDAKGALKMLSDYFGHELYSESNLESFIRVCRNAQSSITEGYTWKNIGNTAKEINKNILIGMAYKFADPNDPIYVEMVKLGRQD